MESTPDDKKLRTIVDRMKKEESHYASTWFSEAVQWETAGIYQQLADEIGPLEPGSLHIDLGSGFGNLALWIKKKNPHATVIGVERNMYFVSRGLDLMKFHGMSPKVIHRELICLHHDGKVSSIFVSEKGLEQFEEKSVKAVLMLQLAQILPYLVTGDTIPQACDHEIVIVMDNIRKLKVLKMLLGDQKADSLSFTFPGGSGRTVFEAPHKLHCGDEELSQEEGERRIFQDIIKTREAVFTFARDVLKPGGKIWCVDRCQNVSDEDVIPRLLIQYRKIMGEKLVPFFEPQTIMATMPIKKKEGPDWALPEQQPSKKLGLRKFHQGQEARITIVSFERKTSST